MRLIWIEEAIVDLEIVADRAPKAAATVYKRVVSLVDSPFPGMFRRVAERPDERVLSVPPDAISYLIVGDAMIVLAIADCRHRRDAW